MTGARPRVLVIGDPGRRNPQLLAALTEFGEPEPVAPVVVGADDPWLQRRDAPVPVVFGRPYLAGELGCLRAHQEAYRRIGQDAAVVLEDDAEVRCWPAIEVAASWCRRHPEAVAILHRLDGATRGAELERIVHAGHEIVVRAVRGVPFQTVAYGCGSRAAQRLTMRQDDPPTLADWPTPGRRLGVRFAEVVCEVHGVPVGEVAGESSIGQRGGATREARIDRALLRALRLVVRPARLPNRCRRATVQMLGVKVWRGLRRRRDR